MDVNNIIQHYLKYPSITQINDTVTNVNSFDFHVVITIKRKLCVNLANLKQTNRMALRTYQLSKLK